MSIDVQQFKDVIVTPVLAALGLHSPSAVNLMLGTCAQESQMGKYLIQQRIGFRGGIGIFQMEKEAYQSIWSSTIVPSVALRSKFKLFLGYEVKPPAERMASDLWLAAAMARIYYYNIKQPLPDAQDIPSLAAYWKKFYNTEKGKGTEQEFINAYTKYIAPSLL